MKYLCNILFLLFTTNCFCQVITNNGSVANILSGTIVSTGSLENVTGTITNNGTLTARYNFNNLATVNGSGNYNVGGNWANNGTFTAGTGVVTFDGAATQNIFSNDAFNNLSINKSGGLTVLSSDIAINGILNFSSGKIQTGGSKVIISSTGTITGSSQGSGWVYGNLQKFIQTGNTSQAYEVGDNTNYTPAAMVFNSVTSSGTLTTNTFAFDHTNLSYSGIDANKSVNRYFNIVNNGIVFTDAAITLKWLASDVDAGASTANFKVAKHNASTWSFQSTSSPNPTSIQVTGITSFGDFAVGEMLSALPVKLTNLRGYTKNYGIQVEWITQSEIDIDRYEIERSANGQQFAKAGVVKARGNSSVIINYSWFDASPFNSINYYRIRSVEKTGQVSYSPVVKVNMMTGRSEINFYPNPVIGNAINLQLKNIPKGNYSFTLTNRLGQQLYKKLLLHNGGSAIHTIPVNNLTSGIYYVQVKGGEVDFIKQVLKN